jgi:hypothetical protein
MLEIARPEARATSGARSEAQRPAWGIVDFILGALMLPFGIWLFLIERMVGAIASLFDR